MLDKLEDILRGQNLVSDEWAEDMRTMADEVALYRRYYDGDHDVYLSDEMKDMLRSATGFRDNYCELVVNTMVDRLMVRGIDTDDEQAKLWAEDMLVGSRFDGLQLDVHEAVVRDGNAFVLVGYDEDTQQATLNFEPAYDGDEGMMVVYDRMGRELVAAVKVWIEVETTRVNIYYPDRVEKYISYTDDEAVTIELMEEPAVWLPGVVPVLHFKNKADRRKRYGKSELKAAISLNDALNRTLISMVMTGELTAFQIRVAKGFDPPQKLQPGSWVVINSEDGLTTDDVADAYTLETGDVTQLIQIASLLIDQIGTITLTPLPSLMGGDSQSGEALKERKDGLIGKVERAQVRFGNTWEDAMNVAAVVYNTYSTRRVDEGARWSARWKEAQMREAASVRENAKLMREAGYELEFLRIMGTQLGYDEAKIQELVTERQEQEARAIASLGGNIAGFDRFAM